MALPRLYAPISLPGIRGGTPLTLDGAFTVLESLVEAQARVERDYYHALRRYQAVKAPRAKQRWRDTMDGLRPSFVRLERAVEQLQNQVDEYGAALVRREEIVAAERARPPKPTPQEDAQSEWQFGLAYEAERRGGHNVDLNVDIRRKDGKLITEREARDALRTRLETGEFPEAYEFALVVYRSPDAKGAWGRKFRDGGFRPDELDETFDDVIGATNIHDWRSGGIEE